jgi:hypothetical protein
MQVAAEAFNCNQWKALGALLKLTPEQRAHTRKEGSPNLVVFRALVLWWSSSRIDNLLFTLCLNALIG